MSTTAILLAAGRGSRMGGATADRPKCLTMLGGRRLLDWQLAAFAQVGVDEVLVVGGYCADQLRAAGCEVIENRRWMDTNMVSSLSCARQHLRAGVCIVAYSDIVFHPDALRVLANCGHPIAITYDRCWDTLWRERFDDPLQDAESFRLDGSRLAEIGRRATRIEDIQGQYMGLLRFAPDGWRRVEAHLSALPEREVDRLDMTALLGRLLASGTAIAALPVDGRWCEVDREADVDLYEKHIALADAGHAAWLHDWRASL